MCAHTLLERRGGGPGIHRLEVSQAPKLMKRLGLPTSRRSLPWAAGTSAIAGAAARHDNTALDDAPGLCGATSAHVGAVTRPRLDEGVRLPLPLSRQPAADDARSSRGVGLRPSKRSVGPGER
jgi:hypothetical protein